MKFVALCKVCLRCSCQKSTVEIEMPCLSCLSACLQGAGLTVALSLVSFRRGCLEGHHEVRSGVKRATTGVQTKTEGNISSCHDWSLLQLSLGTGPAYEGALFLLREAVASLGSYGSGWSMAGLVSTATIRCIKEQASTLPQVPTYPASHVHLEGRHGAFSHCLLPSALSPALVDPRLFPNWWSSGGELESSLSVSVVPFAIPSLFTALSSLHPQPLLETYTDQ